MRLSCNQMIERNGSEWMALVLKIMIYDEGNTRSKIRASWQLARWVSIISQEFSRRFLDWIERSGKGPRQKFPATLNEHSVARRIQTGTKRLLIDVFHVGFTNSRYGYGMLWLWQHQEIVIAFAWLKNAKDKKLRKEHQSIQCHQEIQFIHSP